MKGPSLRTHAPPAGVTRDTSTVEPTHRCESALLGKLKQTKYAKYSFTGKGFYFTIKMQTGINTFSNANSTAIFLRISVLHVEKPTIIKLTNFAALNLVETFQVKII